MKIVHHHANGRFDWLISKHWSVKLQLYDTIYRLRFYSNSLIHILSLSNSHNSVASIQKNRGDKSHRVIVALSCNYTRDLSATILFKLVDSYLIAFKFA